MRVLHLTTHLNTGGITTYILRLVRPFKERRIQTFVLSSGGSCREDFLRAGAVTIELPIKTKSELSPKLFLAFRKARAFILENKIELLHAHTRVTQVFAHFLSKSCGIPYVTTCHGFYTRRLGRRLLPAWGNMAVGISEGVGEHLQNDFKVPAEKVRVVYNGVDIEALDAAYAKWEPSEVKKNYGFGEKDRVVGIVSRLVADKGHEYLFRATQILAPDFPDLRVLIVGEGRCIDDFRKKVEAMGLKDRVVFTGNLSDVTHPLAAMEIFAFPATWREGFGLSIVEAMTCRKPVIVTNIWALNKLIQDGETGIMIPPLDAPALAEAMRGLLNDPVRARRLTVRARAAVECLFTVGRMADELVSVYRAAAVDRIKP